MTYNDENGFAGGFIIGLSLGILIAVITAAVAPDWEHRLINIDKTHHWTIDPSTGERTLEPVQKPLDEGDGK